MLFGEMVKCNSFCFFCCFFYLKCYSWSYVPCEPGLLVILTKGYKQSLVFRMMPELNFLHLSSSTSGSKMDCIMPGKAAYPLNKDIFLIQQQMSRLVGKPTICIGENKDADQLRGNREADQRLCFRYSDSTIPLLLKSKISSL